jgi:RNA polymerase sigma-70 factor (family 1)
MSVNQNLYNRFENLFRDHYNELSNYAFSILRSREDAEDIVQDVYVKLWQNTPSVIETPQAKFYLLTAIRNNCISLLRKQSGKRFVQPEDVHLQAPVVEVSREPAKDIDSLVGQALSLLPPQCLVVFKMSRFGKLTYAQIATELGISPKTVENQVGKALRIMRDFARQNNISFALLCIILSVMQLYDIQYQ